MTTTKRTFEHPKRSRLTPPQLEALLAAQRHKRGAVAKLDDWVQQPETEPLMPHPVAAELAEVCVVVNPETNTMAPALMLADGSMVVLTLDELDTVIFALRGFARMLAPERYPNQAPRMMSSVRMPA